MDEKTLRSIIEEVIKEITGTGESLAGRLIMYDAIAARFETIRYRRQGN